AVPGDAATSQRPQPVQKVLAQDNQRRKNLLQNVAVVLAQQSEVLAEFVSDQLNFAAGQIKLRVSGLARSAQSDQVGQRQLVTAAQVNVAVLGGETVQVRTADRDETDTGQVGTGQVSKLAHFQRHQPSSAVHRSGSG